MPTRPTGPPPWRIANYPALTLAQAVAALFSVEFQVVGRDDFTHQLHVVLAETAVVNLAELPWVSTVETAPTPGVPENFRARSDHRANALAADYGAGRHYDGRNVTMGHDDNGRIKPEVCAMGTNVTSTYGSNTYATISGTSMTCPDVSAQLVGAYRSLNTGAEAPAASLKALLMNTAEDLGNPDPDFRYGYGRINGLRAVRVLEDRAYFRDSLTQGQRRTFTVPAAVGKKQLRVMLHWTDYEGAANAWPRLGEQPRPDGRYRRPCYPTLAHAAALDTRPPPNSTRSKSPSTTARRTYPLPPT